MFQIANLSQIFYASPNIPVSVQAASEGVQLFWDISELLEKDINPTEKQWDSLFAAPGYSFLAKREGKDNIIKRNLPIALMPSKKKELDNLTPSRSNRYITHFLEVARRRKELEDFRQSLDMNEIMLRSLELALVYLPEAEVKNIKPTPKLYFGIFEPGKKTNEEIIFVDLLFAINQNLISFLGHEIHNYYCSRLSGLITPAPNHDDYPLLRSISQLQTVGIADLIDKQKILNNVCNTDYFSDWYTTNYIKHFRNSWAVLQQMDELIQQMADGSTLKWKKGDEIWRLLAMQGHPQGAFMAKLIKDVLGKNVLIATLHSPFKYIYIYNEAALQSDSKNYTFSNKTIEYLASLEQHYLRRS